MCQTFFFYIFFFLPNLLAWALCWGCRNKLPQTGGLHNRHVFSYSSGGWKSKVKVSAGRVSPEASLLGWQMATFPPRPHVTFSLCLRIPGVSSSYEDTSSMGLGPHSDDLV